MMHKDWTISIIGPGALGSSLIDLVRQHPGPFQLHSVWGRNRNDSYLLTDHIRHLPDTGFPCAEHHLGDIVMITCPDDSIYPLAKKLSKQPLQWEKRSVIHFSGSHDSSLLQSLFNKGASTASFHPLQTFTNGDDSNRFKGIWFTFEGDDDVFPRIEKFAVLSGAKVQKLNSDQKKAMHLAAVFASNYLVSLMHTVEQISESNHIDTPLDMLEPLIQQTIDNIFKKGTMEALSGPIARGDLKTIQNHHILLEDNPELKRLYNQLGKQALNMAESSGNISGSKIKLIHKIISEKVDE